MLSDSKSCLSLSIFMEVSICFTKKLINVTEMR